MSQFYQPQPQPPNPGQWQQQPYSQQQQWQSPPLQHWQQPPQLPPTQQPPLPQQPKQKKSWIAKKKHWIAIISVVIAVISLITALLAWIHPFSPAPPHSGVQDTLTEWCNAGLKGDYHTDFNLYAKAFKQLTHETDFVNNAIATTKSHGGVLSCTVDEATDDGSSGRGIITYVNHDGSVLVEQFHLVMEDGSWKILYTCAPGPTCQP